jgi:hypothetical protein
LTENADQRQATDPDNVPETLCIGKFNVAFGDGLATLTFTHGRHKCGPLLENGTADIESVVRARIVTSMRNMVALRDILNRIIKDDPDRTSGAVAGGSHTLN